MVKALLLIEGIAIAAYFALVDHALLGDELFYEWIIKGPSRIYITRSCIL